MSHTRVASILALVATFAVPLSAQAQTTASPAPAASMAPAPPAPSMMGPSPAPSMMGHHHRHHQSLMHALGSLNLTDAQKQQIAAFHSQEQQANQNADTATKHANAAKMRAQIMGVLTPDQKTQLHVQMHHGSSPDAVASPVPQ